MTLTNSFLALLLAATLQAQTTTPPPAQTPAPTTKQTPKPALQQAPGAGPDKVWVNAASNVYHCPGDRYYGKTKNGKYMTEKDAQAAGAHGENKKTCFK